MSCVQMWKRERLTDEITRNIGEGSPAPVFTGKINFVLPSFVLTASIFLSIERKCLVRSWLELAPKSTLLFYIELENIYVEEIKIDNFLLHGTLEIQQYYYFYYIWLAEYFKPCNEN